MYYNVHSINKLGEQNLVKYALTKPNACNYNMVSTINYL